MTTDDLILRPARPEDLESIVRLHEADDLGGHDEAWTAENRPAYEAAFRSLAAETGHGLHVAERGGRVVGTFVLSLLPGLTHRGARHAQLRSVQVLASEQSAGIGAAMVAHAETLARSAGAAWIELTSNLQRRDDHRFYERQGYLRSHASFKKRL